MNGESSSLIDESLLLDANEQGNEKEETPFLMVKEYQIQYQKLEEELFSLKLKYKNLAKEYETINLLAVNTKNENEKLRSELCLLSQNRDFDELKKNNDNNLKEIGELKELLQNAESEKDKLQDQVEQLNNQLEYSEEFAKKQQELPILLKKAEDENKKLHLEVEQLLKDNAVVDDLHDKFRTANELVNTMQEQLKNQDNKNQRNKAKLEDEIKDLKSKLGNAQEELAQTKNQLAKQNDNLNDLRNKNKKDQEELEKLKQEANSEKQKYTTFYAKYEVTRKQYKQIKITEQKTNINFHEYKAKIEKERNELKNEINQLKAKNKQLEEENAKLGNDLKDSQRLLTLQLKKITELRNTANQEQEKFNNEIEANKARELSEKNDLQNEIKELKQKLNKSNELQPENQKLKENLQNSLQKNNQIENMNKDLQNQIITLNKQLVNQRNIVKEREDQISLLRKQLDKVNQEVKNQNDKYEKLQNNYNDEYVKMLQNETNLKEKHEKEMKELESMKNAEVEVYRRENSKMRHVIVNLKSKIAACEKEISEFNDPHAHCILKSDFESMKKDIAKLLSRDDDIYKIVNKTNLFLQSNGISLTRIDNNNNKNTNIDQKYVKYSQNTNSPPINEHSSNYTSNTKIESITQTNRNEFYKIVNQTIRTMTEKVTHEHQEIMKVIGEPCHEPVDISDIIPSHKSIFQ